METKVQPERAIIITQRILFYFFLQSTWWLLGRVVGFMENSYDFLLDINSTSNRFIHCLTKDM